MSDKFCKWKLEVFQWKWDGGSTLHLEQLNQGIFTSTGTRTFHCISFYLLPRTLKPEPWVYHWSADNTTKLKCLRIDSIFRKRYSIEALQTGCQSVLVAGVTFSHKKKCISWPYKAVSALASCCNYASSLAHKPWCCVRVYMLVKYSLIIVCPQ